MKTTVGLGLAALNVALVAIGCAAREDDEVVAADDSAVEVNVCKGGVEIPAANLMYPLRETYATYNAEHGVRAFANQVMYTFSEAEPDGRPLPFNPLEYGVHVKAFFETRQDTLDVSAEFVEGCLGQVRVLPNASIELGTTDAARVEWFCEPNTLAGTKCKLKDGTPLMVSVHPARQLYGFVSTTEALNLRRSPTTDNIVLEVLPPNASVKLTGQLQSGFLSAEYNGKRGWVSEQFVRPFRGTVVTTDGLNLRDSPTTQSLVSYVIPKGTKITAYGQEGWGQFMAVEVGERWGWVSGQFLKDATFDPNLPDPYAYPKH